MRIYEIVAVIIDSITDLRVSVWNTEVSVAGITDTIVVGVFLAPIDDFRAIVAGIADSVFILILLIRVW